MNTSIFFEDFKMQKKGQFTFLPFIYHGRFYILIGYIVKHLDITKVFQTCFHAVWIHNQRVEKTFSYIKIILKQYAFEIHTQRLS